MPFDLENAARTVDSLRSLGMVDRREQSRILAIFDPEFPFAQAVAFADSVHVHVKVDDTDQLRRDDLEAAGYRLDHAKPGFVKFVHETGVHLIASSIPVSEDELAESPFDRRPRPFVDHLGIDLRQASDAPEGPFADVPRIAEREGWGVVDQGDTGRPVHCCHVRVARKHWIFPGGNSPQPHLPLEFAYGPLEINPDGSGGCDLRPADPASGRTRSRATPCDASGTTSCDAPS